MKARVKATGVLIDVIPKCNTNAQHSGNNLYVCDNMIFRECDLDFLNIENSAIDWEQRRYELAKAAMQGIFSDKDEVDIAYTCMGYKESEKHTVPKAVAQYAVSCADALIEELKKGD